MAEQQLGGLKDTMTYKHIIIKGYLCMAKKDQWQRLQQQTKLCVKTRYMTELAFQITGERRDCTRNVLGTIA